MINEVNAVERLVELIQEIEVEYDFYNLTVGETQVYPYIRLPLFYCLSEVFGLTSKQVNNLKIGKGKAIRSLVKVISSYGCSLFHRESGCDLIVIEHPKKTKFKEYLVDEYSYFLTEELLKKFDVRVLVHPNSTGTDEKSPYDKSKCLHYDTYVYERKVVELFLKLSPSISKVSKFIVNSITNRLNVSSLDLYRFVRALIIKGVAEEKVAAKIIKKYNPKAIGSVVSYGHAAAFNSVAKKLGVSTFEIQHGSISENHLGYSYPGVSVNIFPDYLLTFGEFWSKNACYPIHESRRIASGFVKFDQARRLISNRQSDYILFISQNVNYIELAGYARTLAKTLPEETVIFKLHPKLQGNKEVEDLIYSGEKIPNLKVAASKEKTIYDYLTEAKCQIGVFSTAIYEGIGLNVPTMILKLNGWTVMQRLGCFSSVTFISDQRELVEACKRVSEEKSGIDSHNMFEFDALEKSVHAVQNILNKNLS